VIVDSLLHLLTSLNDETLRLDDERIDALPEAGDVALGLLVDLVELSGAGADGLVDVLLTDLCLLQLPDDALRARQGLAQRIDGVRTFLQQPSPGQQPLKGLLRGRLQLEDRRRHRSALLSLCLSLPAPKGHDIGELNETALDLRARGLQLREQAGNGILRIHEHRGLLDAGAVQAVVASAAQPALAQQALAGRLGGRMLGGPVRERLLQPPAVRQLARRQI